MRGHSKSIKNCVGHGLLNSRWDIRHSSRGVAEVTEKEKKIEADRRDGVSRRSRRS